MMTPRTPLPLEAEPIEEAEQYPECLERIRSEADGRLGLFRIFAYTHQEGRPRGARGS